MLDLHVPDEPVGRADAWRSALRQGGGMDDVLAGDDGLTAWLWSRWRGPLAATGMDEDGLRGVVGAYRRELRLWLEGERTWAQCCSGLIGRISRRADGGDAAEA